MHAETAPAQIEAGAPAVELTVALSENVGEVTGSAGAESGITIASPGDLPRTDIAAEESPQPIKMSEAGNSWTLGVSTAQATPGTHEVTLTGTAGDCRAQITVG